MHHIIVKKKNKIEEGCEYSDKFNMVIHKYNAAEYTCRCGMETVAKYVEPPRGWRKGNKNARKTEAKSTGS